MTQSSECSPSCEEAILAIALELQNTEVNYGKLADYFLAIPLEKVAFADLEFRNRTISEGHKAGLGLFELSQLIYTNLAPREKEKFQKKSYLIIPVRSTLVVDRFQFTPFFC
jgi:hypothetical protein